MAETEFARSAENFQYWLANMSDALEDYLETVPASLKNKLDFSETSLRPFEAHLLERFNDVDALLNDDGLDGAAIYTGEAFRKLAGGTWALSDNAEGELYHGLPVLNDVGLRQTVVCPHFLVRSVVQKRRGDVLAKLLKRNLTEMSI